MSMTTKWPWVMIISAGIGLRVGIASIAPLLDSVQTAFSVSTSALGWLTAIPVICMGALSFVGSVIERRWGPKRGMLLALGILATGLLWRGWADHFGVLVLTAVLVGVGDAIIRPLLSGFIKHAFGDNVHSAMSVYAASMGLGAALAGYMTPRLAVEFQSWQWGLGCWAIPVIIALLVWMRWSELPPSAQQHSAVPKRLAMTGTLWLMLFFALQAGINYTAVAWLPSLYSENNDASGGVIAVLLCVQTLASLLFPLLLHRTGRSLLGIMPFFILITAIGILLIASAPLLGDSSKWGAAVLLGIGTGGLFPIALSLPLNFSSSGHEATRLSSVSQSGGYTLGGIMPWVAGSVIVALGKLIGLVVLCFAMLLLLGIAAWRLAHHYARYATQ